MTDAEAVAPPEAVPKVKTAWHGPIMALPRNLQYGLVFVVLFGLYAIYLNGKAVQRPLAAPSESMYVAPTTDDQAARLEMERQRHELAEAGKREIANAGQPTAPTSGTLNEEPETYQSRPTSHGGGDVEPVEDHQAAPKMLFLSQRRKAETQASPVAAIPSPTMPQEPQMAVTPPSTPPAQPTLATPSYTATSTTLREGTIINAVLTHQVNAVGPGPVICRVTNRVYGYDGNAVLIPQGATLLGTSAFNATHMMVSFTKVQMPPPDGRTYDLNQFAGLSQIGDLGLRAKVNNHFMSLFGAAALVGVIDGLSQRLSYGGGDHNTNVVIGDMAGRSSQSVSAMLEPFLNRRPEAMLPPSTIVNVFVMSNLEMPVWKDRP